ncbi:MAG: signal peptidase I [Pyrinomonadaceae bacterium]|nr:signal peptidase I [Pyrinomonadaceae bacterium]
MSKKENEKEEIHQKKTIAPPKSLFREYFESFVTTLIMAIFGMTFILQAVTVPTGSMQNTILIGDYLLVNKFIFAPGGKPIPFLPQREIQRGDIIVFKYPGNKVHPEKDAERNPPIIPYQVNYVKRVIGMPGDKIEFRGNQVFINDQLLPEHRVIGDSPSRNQQAALKTKEFEPRQPDQKYDVYYSEYTMKMVQNKEKMDNGGYEFAVPGKPMKVPDDSYFVMGDSRDNSEDSRYWGFVHRDLIIGRAMFVYWSCDRSQGSMLSCITSPRFDRIGKMIR